MSSGSPRLIRVPEMTNVENVVAKCPRISVLELARILNTDYMDPITEFSTDFVQKSPTCG